MWRRQRRAMKADDDDDGDEDKDAGSSQPSVFKGISNSCDDDEHVRQAFGSPPKSGASRSSPTSSRASALVLLHRPRRSRQSSVVEKGAPATPRSSVAAERKSPSLIASSGAQGSPPTKLHGHHSSRCRHAPRHKKASNSNVGNEDAEGGAGVVSEDTFESVVGLEEAKARLWQMYAMANGNSARALILPTPPKALLLFGPAGTAKSHLAAAISSALAPCLLFAPRAATLRGSSAAEAAANLNSTLDAASAHAGADEKASALVYLDEVELLEARASDALFLALDHLPSRARVVVVVATEAIARMSAALLRRFSVRIRLDHPTRAERRQLVEARLAAVYDSPWIPSGSRTLAGALHNIATYGAREREGKDGMGGMDGMASPLCLSRVGTRSKRRASPPHASPEDPEEGPLDLSRFLDATGPSLDALDEMKKRRPAASEFSESAVSRYGYSGYDIYSIMEGVVRRVAARALSKCTLDAYLSMAIAAPSSSSSSSSSASAFSAVREIVPSSVRPSFRTLHSPLGYGSSAADSTRVWRVYDASGEKHPSGARPSAKKPLAPPLHSPPPPPPLVTFDVRNSDFLAALAEFGEPTTSEAQYLEATREP